MRTNCAHARCTSSLPLHYLCSKSTRGDFLSRHGLRSVHSDRAPPGVPGTMGQRLVHVEPPATRPRFNNVEPRSREERLAIRDKDMLEKLRLEHRLKSNAKEDLNSNLLEPPPNSAGFISEADRFCTDAAVEEFADRQRRKLEREVRRVWQTRMLMILSIL